MEEKNDVSGLERNIYNDKSIELSTKNFLRKITDWYFEPMSFERDGRIYERLGVKRFKRTYIGFMKRYLITETLRGRDEKSLQHLINSTKWYEGTHLVLNCGLSILIASELANGYYKGAALLGLVNTLTNIYPIMMQRYNRGRLYKTLERVQNRNDVAL